MMMLLRATVVLLFLLVATPVWAQQGVGEHVRIEPVSTLPVIQLWQAGRAEVVWSDRGAVVSVWRFNYENHPDDGPWAALGLVGVGMGDLGETPVVFRVWARGASEQADFTQFAAVVVPAEPSQSGAFDLAFGPGRGSAVLAVGQDGSVSLDGRPLGVIR
jgi:hypothetical protein